MTDLPIACTLQDAERQCCGCLRFRLTVEPGGGPPRPTETRQG
jgi:hypothetical protein